ncbi:MAG: hypothetical protein LBK60_11425 [Verrucomicrobiales bacterium]|jgi:hypothetical protein|nr:hypothetical protein [Verrucomicrobiales bacterium]
MATKAYVYANYIPVGIDKQYHWVNNITDNALAAKADFKSIPANIWTQLGERRGYIVDAYNAVHEGRKYLATLTQVEHDAFNGHPDGNYDSITILPAPGGYFPTGDQRMKAGTLPWFAKVFVPLLTADPAWNASMTEQYGLTPIKKNNNLSYHDFNLSVVKTVDGQNLQLKGVKGDFKTLLIRRRINSQGELDEVKTVTRLPWTDPRPLTDKAETREYQVQGLVKDEPYGAPSQIFIITARRTLKIEEESV